MVGYYADMIKIARISKCSKLTLMAKVYPGNLNAGKPDNSGLPFTVMIMEACAYFKAVNGATELIRALNAHR